MPADKTHIARTVNVAVIQCALGGNVTDNLPRVERLIRDAASRGAHIVLPPELFEGAYFPQQQREEAFELAREAEEHPTIGAMQRLAAELNVAIPVSFFEKDGPVYYNSVAMVDADGAVLGIYRKSHIPDGPGYEEKFYFRPGNTGFKVWNTRHGRVGVGICWDQWFPEAARAMALGGAELLLYPTAIGSEPEEPEVDTAEPWRRVMVGHAVANAIPVAAANRVGTEEGLSFYGESFICDQRGDILAEVERSEEGVAIAELDLNAIGSYRANWGFFRDRRPDLYGVIADDERDD